MTKPLQWEIGLSLTLITSLFFVLWHFSAPIRTMHKIRREVEEQALLQMRGVKDTAGNTFKDFQVYDIFWAPKNDRYIVSPKVLWNVRLNSPQNYSFESILLFGDGKAYRGDWTIPHIAPESRKRKIHFEVR